LPSEEVDEERGGYKAASLFPCCLRTLLFRRLSRIKIEGVGKCASLLGSFRLGLECKMQLAAGFPASKVSIS
ncbi:MAG TPA: hypothetical protein VJW55_08125, partial [Candidatus Angelobacter sp.]|nr:hypothetical protein [Candidatus Angelobacter sp.]